MPRRGTCKKCFLDIFIRRKPDERESDDRVPAVPPDPAPNLHPPPIALQNDGSTPNDAGVEGQLPTTTTPIPSSDSQTPGKPEGEAPPGIVLQSHEMNPQNMCAENGHRIPAVVPANNLPQSTESQDSVTYDGRCWDAAYEKVRKADPELTEFYENLLLKSRNIEKDEHLETNRALQEQLQNLVNDKLQELENKKLYIKIGSKNVYPKKVVHDAVRGIIAVKDVISSVVSSEPHAAVAWAGVLVLLPILLNPITQEDDASRGLEVISDLLPRCHFMEDKILRHFNNSEELHISIKQKTVDLYANILGYQMHLAAHYDNSKMKQFADNLIIKSNWKSMIDEITKMDKDIASDLEVHQHGTVQHIEDDLRVLSDNLNRSLEKLEENIQTIKESTLLSKLNSVDSAAFNSNEEGSILCLKDTQVKVLERIQEWIQNPNQHSIFWLHGMAGTGKSTIARTVATKLNDRMCFTGDETLPDSICLGSTFFFNQRNSNRSDPKALFPTLARRLLDSLPDLAEPLCKAIKEHDDIASKIPGTQWKELISQPFQHLDTKLLQPLIVVFVIDALDECKDVDSLGSNLESILYQLGQLPEMQRLQVRILITSRPKADIQSRFQRLLDNKHDNNMLNKIPHANADGTPTDIDKYLKSEFKTIKETHRFDDQWPGPERLDDLVVKADGLFIFAATVCRFLQPFGVNVDKRLNMVFENVIAGGSDGGSPQKKLDDLYTSILKDSITKDTLDIEIPGKYDMFQDIVGAIINLFDTISISDLANLIAVRHCQPTDQLQEVETMIDQLGSVLKVPKDSYHSVELLHLSFRDFLVDSERCGKDLHINEEQAHKKLFGRCIDIMNATLRRNICHIKHVSTPSAEVDPAQLKEYLPKHAEYACCHWADHFQESGLSPPHDILRNFLKTHFTHWLEAMSLMGKMDEGILMLTSLHTHLPSALSTKEAEQLLAMIQDAKRFTVAFKSAIEEAPLQVYVSALLFSPKKSLIRECFKGEIPKWIIKDLGGSDHWSPLLHTVQGHLKQMDTSRYSPDGKLLASFCWDGNIRLWDVSTWRCLQELKEEDHSWGSDAAFLSNTSLVHSSGCSAPTTRLWDLVTGDHKVLNISKEINKIVCSPNGKKLACREGSRDGIHLYNLDTHESQQIPGSYISEFSFSPNKKMVAAFDEDGVYIWDTDKTTQLHHFECVQPTNLAFSLDGEALFCVSRKGTIQLFDVDTKNTHTCINFGSSDEVESAFSPARTSIAILSDRSLDVWQLSTGRKTASLLGADLEDYNKIVWSSKGDQVATVTKGCFNIWNVNTGALINAIETQNQSIQWDLSPDGRSMVTCVPFKTEVQAWDLTTGTSTDTADHLIYCFEYISFSPNSRLMVCAENTGGASIFNIDTGDLVQTLDIPEVFKRYYRFLPPLISFSANGKRLIYTNGHEPVAVWNVTGRLLRIIDRKIGSTDKMVAEISSDGNTVASAYENGIELFDVTSGEKLGDFKTSNGYAESLAFSLDGLSVAAGFKDSVEIFEIRTGAQTRLPKDYWNADLDRYRKSLAFSPDSARIAVAEKEGISIWEIATGERKGVVRTNRIHEMNFSSDGKYLHTDQGRFQVDSILDNSDSESKHVGERFYYHENWVFYGEQKIIYVPPECRLRYSPSHDGILAFKNMLGGFSLIKLSGEGVGTLG